MSAAEQLGLLDHNGRVHSGGHDTEHAAAKSVDARVLRERVLRLLQEHSEGLTDDEGAELLGPWADRLTFGRRRNELVTVGLVVKTDERRVTPHGRNAIVWRAVAAVEDFAAPYGERADRGRGCQPGHAPGNVSVNGGDQQ